MWEVREENLEAVPYPAFALTDEYAGQGAFFLTSKLGLPLHIECLMKLVIIYHPSPLTRDSTSLSKPLTGSKQPEITLVAIPLSLPVASKVHLDKSKSKIQH